MARPIFSAIRHIPLIINCCPQAVVQSQGSLEIMSVDQSMKFSIATLHQTYVTAVREQVHNYVLHYLLDIGVGIACQYNYGELISNSY